MHNLTIEWASASKTFSTILRTVARDQDVKAIVLRVNSPGGRYALGRRHCRALVFADFSSARLVLWAPTPSGGKQSGPRKPAFLSSFPWVTMLPGTVAPRTAAEWRSSPPPLTLSTLQRWLLHLGRS